MLSGSRRNMLGSLLRAQRRTRWPTISFKILIAMGGKPEIRRHLEEEEGKTVADEDVEEMWESLTDFDSYSAELSVNEHVVYMAQSIKAAYEIFMGRAWGLIKCERRTLLIPDHPVTLVRDEEMPAFVGVGLGTAAAILMPIGRRAAIMMAGPGEDFVVRPHAKLAKELNQRFAFNARKELYHHPDDNPLEGIKLPPVREREMRMSQPPESYLMPDGPSETFKTAMSSPPEPPAQARVTSLRRPTE